MRQIIPVIAFMSFLDCASALAETITRPSLRIALIEGAPLVTHNQTDGDIGGEVASSVRIRIQLCGLEPEFILSPSWNRAYLLAKSGEVDGIAPTQITEDRKSYFEFPKTPILEIQMAAFVLESRSIGVRSNNIWTLPISIGLLRGAAWTEAARREHHAASAALSEYHSYESLFENLAGGRLQVVIAPAPIALAVANRVETLSEIRALTPSLGRVAGYLALSKRAKNNAEISRNSYACLVSN